MGEPFIGEIRMAGFNFAPKDWAMCDGTVMTINQNPALYALIGTAYGGDGVTSFKLPDMRGRVPVHKGTLGPDLYERGGKGGLEWVTLTGAQLPNHTHVFDATSEDANNLAGQGKAFAVVQSNPPGDTNIVLYREDDSPAQMNTDTCTAVGGGQSHVNTQPSSVINFIIALQGTFPPRN